MVAARKTPPTDEADAAYVDLLRRAEMFGIRRPDPVPVDQAWFWTYEWLAGTLEALEEVAAGHTYTQYTDEEFIAFLEERAADADARRGG
jgi:hypothetical protein